MHRRGSTCRERDAMSSPGRRSRRDSKDAGAQDVAHRVEGMKCDGAWLCGLQAWPGKSAPQNRRCSTYSTSPSRDRLEAEGGKQLRAASAAWPCSLASSSDLHGGGTGAQGQPRDIAACPGRSKRVCPPTPPLVIHCVHPVTGTNTIELAARVSPRNSQPGYTMSSTLQTQGAHRSLATPPTLQCRPLR